MSVVQSPELASLTPEVLTSIRESIRQHGPDVNERINQPIFNHPEVAGTEETAHNAICDFFEGLGSNYTVTRHAYTTSSLKYSLKVDAGTNSGRLVVFNAEYDALPRMAADSKGPAHACGHNLIASASVAAFIAASKALKQTAECAEWRLRLLGTPSEESGGGKVQLIRQNAYQDVSACLMVHPSPLFKTRSDVRAVSVTRSLASQRVSVTFQGQAAHAGIAPWNGKNALDAMVTAYVGLSTLRQRFKSTDRLNGIIREGGKAANIIPDSVSAEFSVRAATRDDLQLLERRVVGCLEAGAKATDCPPPSVKSGTPYIDLQANRNLCSLFTTYMGHYGHNVLNELPEITDHPGSSTDQGNVSYVCPAMQPIFTLDSEAGNHTPGFTDAAGTPDAFQRAMACAEGMAAVACAVMTNEEAATKAFAEFGHTVEKVVRRERANIGKCDTGDVRSAPGADTTSDSHLQLWMEESRSLALDLLRDSLLEPTK